MIWFDFTNTSTGTSTTLRALDAVTGQTILFIGCLVALCALGVAASSAGGRFLWGGLGLLMAGLVLAGAIWALVDPESFSSNMATTQAISKLALPGSIESASDAATKAFDDGTLTVSARIGVWVALIAGLNRRGRRSAVVPQEAPCRGVSEPIVDPQAIDHARLRDERRRGSRRRCATHDVEVLPPVQRAEHPLRDRRHGDADLER